MKRKQKDRNNAYNGIGKNEKVENKASKQQLAWDRLDNTANLFPVIATENMTNVYRISVALTEKVDSLALQEALNRVLPWFDVFRMRLRKGMFWYYFEENKKNPPLVEEEHSFPGSYIDRSRNRNYMFRVSYYQNRINLEVFHALTDGSGAITFFKELIYQYLRLMHKELLQKDKDKISSGLFLDKEDSYVKNFKKPHSKVYKSEKAVLVKGEKLAKGELGVIHGYLPVEQLKKASKARQVTINQYLVGTYIYSIYKEYLHGAVSKQPITCCVPVNLRPYYDSHTMKNFFAVVSALFRPEQEHYTKDEVIEMVATSLKEQITFENLDNILSYNVSNEKKMILRVVPLWIKNVAMKRIYGMSARANSSTVTNIGNIELKEAYQPYVNHFYVTLSMSKGQNIKGGVCSYNGTLVFTISSVLEDVSIQKRLFTEFAKDGIEVVLESNGVYYE